MGFVLVNRDKTIMLAGAMNGRAISGVQGELNALIMELKCFLERSFQPQNIYIDCAVLVDWIQKDEPEMAWRAKEKIVEI